ncbi:MAG: TIGR04282 family arsenosugar biosynthesis glycosyltransferase [Thermoanaerobaculia bacterium]
MQRLVLFAKDPRAGRVKTRLARDTDAAWAARLYEAFLEDLAAAVVRPASWEAVLAHGEAEAGHELSRLFGPRWTLRPQGAGDLGERLERAFCAARDEGMSRTVVIGSDAPTLTPDDIERAFQRLAVEPGVVFSPSPDGGYALIGLSRNVNPRGLFDGVRWSTCDALADTEGAALARGARVERLPPVPDIDTRDDLAPLRQRLEAERSLAPRTLEVLREETWR